MTEYDYWKIFPRMPKKVTLGDITVRDGFQHLEKFVSTRAKIFYAEEMIFAGCRNIEVTNLGNPYLMPQFSDAEQTWRTCAATGSKAAAKSGGSTWTISPSPQ
jgi:hydroxymethylglutaryl-CoA lyase